jgi:hypothetical protein
MSGTAGDFVAQKTTLFVQNQLLMLHDKKFDIQHHLEYKKCIQSEF